MAITAATKTSNLAGFIRPEIAQAYFAEVQKASGTSGASLCLW